MIAARSLSRPLATRATRSFSAAAPKAHKAKGNWDQLKSKRPVDHDDLHVRSVSDWRFVSF